LLALPLRSWAPALLLLAFAVLLHLVGYMGQQPKLSIVALFIGIYALMGMAWGRQFLLESFFPFCLFVFCVPLGWSGVSITFPLRVLVCRIVEVVCGYLLQIDVRVDGTAILDPTGRFQYEVAAACSGLRSLIATLAIAVIYAMVSFRTWWKRALLIGSALPLAVFGNVVRMLTIVIAADLGGQKWGNWIHEGGPGGVFSLLPYIPAFGGLMVLGHWMREPSGREETKAHKNPEPDGADDAGTMGPVSGRPIQAVE